MQQAAQKTQESSAGIDKKKPEPAKQFPELKIGAITEVFGVQCMLANVNTGQRRLTMVPVNSGTGVPNPVSQRSRPAPPPKQGKGK